MIEPDLVAHLLYIIRWHCTWIDVLDFNTYGETVILDSANRITKIRCRVMRLEVRVGKFGFQRFQILSLPEPDIESAICQLSAQSAFRKRVQMKELTFADLNRIIEIASDGAIELELEDF